MPLAYIPLEDNLIVEKDVDAIVDDSNRVKVGGSENMCVPLKNGLLEFVPAFFWEKSELLGSGTFMDSCTTHTMLWGLVNLSPRMCSSWFTCGILCL